MRRSHKQCKAYARSTGLPCMAKGLSNGRCPNHGGLSTGPRTQTGKLAIALATKKRMADGQLQAAKDGFRRWFNARGQLRLKHIAQLKANKSELKRIVNSTLINEVHQPHGGKNGKGNSN